MVLALGKFSDVFVFWTDTYCKYKQYINPTHYMLTVSRLNFESQKHYIKKRVLKTDPKDKHRNSKLQSLFASCLNMILC